MMELLCWLAAIVCTTGWLVLFVLVAVRRQRRRRLALLDRLAIGIACLWFAALLVVDLRRAHGYRRAAANFDSVVLGMSHADVRRVLGSPLRHWESGWESPMGPYDNWCYYRGHLLPYLRRRFPFVGLPWPFEHSPMGVRRKAHVVRFNDLDVVSHLRKPYGQWQPPIEE